MQTLEGKVGQFQGRLLIFQRTLNVTEHGKASLAFGMDKDRMQKKLAIIATVCTWS
jgi:hypothetical protein